MRDERLALFLLLGKTADQRMGAHPENSPATKLELHGGVDLARTLPGATRKAQQAAMAFQLFFVFENYLRDIVLDVLSESDQATWWSRVPSAIQSYVKEQEEKEEAKQWMQVGSRSKLALVTYGQLLDIIEQRWDQGFSELVRDKSLLQQARVISHLRNATCHMYAIPDEEIDRIRTVIGDWFRMVVP